MTDDPGGRDLDELRRIAFGRTDTAADELAASDARWRLAQIARAVNDRGTAEGPAIPAAGGLPEETAAGSAPFTDAERARNEPVATATPADLPRADDSPTLWWPLRSRRNLAFVVVAAFVVGAIASAGFMSLRTDSGAVASASSSATPSPTRTALGFDADQIGAGAIGPGGEPDAQPSDGSGSAVPAAVNRTGDARAALRWFDSAQSDADKTTGIGPLESSKGVPVDPASTRLVQTTSVASVWVAKGTPSLVNTFCLIIGNAAEHSWGTSCANAVDFTSVGLQLTYPSPVPDAAPLTAIWTGTDITLSFGPE